MENPKKIIFVSYTKYGIPLTNLEASVHEKINGCLQYISLIHLIEYTGNTARLFTEAIITIQKTEDIELIVIYDENTGDELKLLSDIAKRLMDLKIHKTIYIHKTKSPNFGKGNKHLVVIKKKTISENTDTILLYLPNLNVNPPLDELASTPAD